MRRTIAAGSTLLVVGLLASGCAVSRPMKLKSNALDYLYPQGSSVIPAKDVVLEVPTRVGVAFPPAAGYPGNDPFTEVQKQQLLERIADAFRQENFIASIEVIPSSYLTPKGGFEELSRLSSAFGIDLMALVSYDQQQFAETSNAAWTYLTVVGAFAIRGEKNETRTLMDAVVYDVRSRTLLFRAAGESTLSGRSTPVKVDRALRQKSEQAFDLATDDLIDNLNLELERFRERAKTGTVRGVGTPAIEIVRQTGGAVEPGSGAGAFGLPELIAAIALAAALGAGRRRRSV